MAEILPSFDVVRVEPSGEAVIAGRAAPGSKVTLRAGSRVLGTVTADELGQWVLVLETLLEPGSYELSLESRLPGGGIVMSENVVVISVPQPQVAAAESEATQQPAPDVTVQSGIETTTVGSPAPEAPATQAEPAPATEADQPLAVLMPRSGEGLIRVLQQTESVRGGLGEGALVLETVDYDAQGRTRVGGRSIAGSRLVVYLDNQAAGDAEAAVNGHWEATLDSSIAPGLHTLRVDQLADDGQVTARVETPFSRAAVLSALPSESAVIVQPGNSLWRISRRVYGEGVRFSVIYRANRDQIRNPDLIYPGQIFLVPTTN